MMRRPALPWALVAAVILLGACHSGPAAAPTPTPAYVVVPHHDLVLQPLDQAALSEPGIPGCRLADLRPFGWKTVDSGLVDIRTPDEYAVQVDSLYQEGYLDYLQTRVEDPVRDRSMPEMSYEQFLAVCNVFPAVDFARFSLLGLQATGTGCTVTFEKRVYRDDQTKRVRYEVGVTEQGGCDLVHLDRNLILVPRIPPEYQVEYVLPPAKDGRFVVPPAARLGVTPETSAELVAGNNRFALDLYHAVAQKETNLFFSPLSISTALAMAYAGARGETAAQMADVLHVTLPPTELFAVLDALSRQWTVSGAGGGFELTSANALWGQQGVPFLPDFLALLAARGAGPHWVDFQSEAGRQAAGAQINRWVHDATAGRVSDLVDPRLFSDLTRLVLTNAITFDGRWEIPFDDTAPAAFATADGTSILVSLMRRRAITPYAAGDTWQAAALPYRDGRAHLLIVLPATGHWETFACRLDAALLAEIEAALTLTDLTLYLPRLAYTADLSLTETLRAMGMTLPFSDTAADFSGMAEIRPSLRISLVRHKATVVVDELGTAASAATAVELEVGTEPSQPVIMRADRPFLLLIRDAEHGAILFLGHVVDPAAP